MFRSRCLVVFVGVVLAGALLQAFAGPGGISRFLGVSAASYFLTLLVLAVVVALFAPAAAPGSDHHEADDSWPGGSSEFLCDTCRYNDVRDCHRTERPNATSCEDYRRR